MASFVFDVTPEQLESSANNIEGKSKEFTKTYNGIYTAVKDLRIKYKGEASETFNKKIESYKNDFTAADKALSNYVQFLRQYASDIKSAENNIKAKANSLSIGR